MYHIERLPLHSHLDHQQVCVHGWCVQLQELEIMNTTIERRFLATLPQGACCCLDPDCEAGHGREVCPEDAYWTLYRSDMDDHWGTPMCEACGQDALGSGVYRID